MVKAEESSFSCISQIVKDAYGERPASHIPEKVEENAYESACCLRRHGAACQPQSVGKVLVLQ